MHGGVKILDQPHVSRSVALAAWAPFRRGLATDPVRALRAE
jgi:hypothetical protein